MTIIYPDDGTPRHDLMTANFMHSLAHDIVSVQPMNIGDVTMGGENIFSYSYEKMMFDRISHNRWEDDGGQV
jgi:hypothetical protein